MRAPTMAEFDTFGQGITAHTRRILTVGAALNGAGEGGGVTVPADEASPGERLEAIVCPDLPKTEGAVWLTYAHELLPTAIARLSREEQRVVIGYYFDQQSIADLAATNGLDQRGASLLIQSALAHLREILRYPAPGGAAL